MTDVEVIPGVAGGIVFAGWAGRKLLGPLFDEIADDWRDRYSERRVRNLNRIGRNAEAKLGADIDAQGEVHPRVALRVMDEGSWCDADVMTEYFGGILAASRSKDGADDRGASWAGLVARLSTFDIYLHYLAYDALRRLYLGRTDLNFGIADTRAQCEVYLPASATLSAMDVEVGIENWSRFILPSIHALLREDLLGDEVTYGTPEFLSEKKAIDAPDGGLVLTPSVAGLELFLWAHGHGYHHPNDALRTDLSFDAQEALGSVEGAQLVDVMRRERSARLADVVAEAAKVQR